MDSREEAVVVDQVRDGVVEWGEVSVEAAPRDPVGSVSAPAVVRLFLMNGELPVIGSIAPNADQK